MTVTIDERTQTYRESVYTRKRDKAKETERRMIAVCRDLCV